MAFNREINRLLLLLLAGFLLVTLSAAYWAVVGPDTLLPREDNARLFEAEASILRGAIHDRQDTPLAYTIPGSGRMTIREYLHPAMNSALGYFSLRYGTGGAENAYNAILRGDNLPADLNTFFGQQVLHRPRAGSDIQLSFDLSVQQQIVDAMGDQPGAVFVMSVPDGQVLALVSLPTYNPNTLDTDWETLVDAPGKPFFNRVLQGSYQPGSMLQTPLMAAAILAGRPLDLPIENAANPVVLNDLVLTCLITPPQETLTLAEAYAFGCPAPFAQLAEELGERPVLNTFSSFRLDNPVTLSGFTPDPPPTPAETALQNALLNMALGQGRLTVNPLSMAAIAAAVVNEGNAPGPLALLATRPPGTEEWVPAQIVRPSSPLTTTPVATALRDLMIQSVAAGAAAPAAREGLVIGGHSGRALAGDGEQFWFIGFVRLAERHYVVTAVVLEGPPHPSHAAEIGGIALEAAYHALQGE